MTTSVLDQHIDAVRRFNRFYTQQIGVLTDSYLDSPFSLTEARVIYELAHHDATTATQLSNDLGLDPGYLSRMLRQFSKQDLVEKQQSPNDGRQSLLRLTDQGKAAFAALNARSHNDFVQMLSALAPVARQRLVDAMLTIQQLLNTRGTSQPAFKLRAPRPGDMGWVVARHGALYAEEYGWDMSFEALVAGIVGEFVQQYDPERERCWIAEIDGRPVGSIFLVKKTATIAKLRLLLVEPSARGYGIGRRLIDECIAFAQQAGYTTLTLWTNSILVAARRLYEQTGFVLVDAAQHHSFGHDLIGETWEVSLTTAPLSERH